MVNLWRRRKFIRVVRKAIRKHEKENPPSLDKQVGYAIPTKYMKKLFITKRKIWFKKFDNGEVNNICREVLHYKYCTPIEVRGVKSLYLEQAGAELCSLSGYFEELLKSRKRLSTFILSLLLSTSFITLVLVASGFLKALFEKGYNLIH